MLGKHVVYLPIELMFDNFIKNHSIYSIAKIYFGHLDFPFTNGSYKNNH